MCHNVVTIRGTVATQCVGIPEGFNTEGQASSTVHTTLHFSEVPEIPSVKRPTVIIICICILFKH